MIEFRHKGDFEITTRFFKRASSKNYVNILEKYGALGVKALAAATPVDTQNTANSWEYSIWTLKQSYVLAWSNTNKNNGATVAILIQYGHATRNGGYVMGRDYINPAMRPILDGLSQQIWQEVKRL